MKADLHGAILSHAFTTCLQHEKSCMHDFKTYLKTLRQLWPKMFCEHVVRRLHVTKSYHTVNRHRATEIDFDPFGFSSASFDSVIWSSIKAVTLAYN